MILEGDDAERMLPYTAWAGYLNGAETPSENEQPTAYILILADKEISEKGYELDAGAAGMSIILAAEEEGIASCWLGALNRESIAREFGIDERFIINSAIALGYPADTSFVTEYNGDIKYFRSEDGKFFVPKRNLDSILIKKKEFKKIY